MEGQAHWITLAVVGAGGAAVLGLVWRATVAGRRRTHARRQFVCPFKDAHVSCELSRSTLNGRFIEVESCSAFDPPERVLCSRQCVALLNRHELPEAQHA